MRTQVLADAKQPLDLRVWAVEGTAYLSMFGEYKDRIATDDALLTTLFAMAKAGVARAWRSKGRGTDRALARTATDAVMGHGGRSHGVLGSARRVVSAGGLVVAVRHYNGAGERDRVPTPLERGAGADQEAERVFGREAAQGTVGVVSRTHRGGRGWRWWW